MTTDLIAAGTALAETLETENDALTALDLPRAGAMLARKQRALADMAATQNTAVPNDAAERMVRRLQGLAVENKRLLERALAAQGRVLSVVAQAATSSSAPTGYGSIRAGSRPTPLALLAKV